jgi:ribonuclease P protein component
MRRGAEFGATVRRGRKAATPTVVVHLAPPVAGVSSTFLAPPRVGFVVSKAVGTAVTRNEVRRRLRHLVRARLDRLPAGASLVVRALPAAAGARSDELARHLDAALGRLLRTAEAPA